MSKEINGPDMAPAFAVAASADTKAEAKAALNNLVGEYIQQGKTLPKLLRGQTNHPSSSVDREMADKLTAHLQQTAFQIHLQSLICARLDGMNVDDMIGEIKTLIDEQAPGAPGL